MVSSTPSLSKLLRVSSAWQRFVEVSPDGIDEALNFVDYLERSGLMAREEAGRWRWKVMACWAEQHRRSRAEEPRRKSTAVPEYP